MQVDFNAKNDYEYINNYKILQAAFTKLGIDKVGVCNYPAAWLSVCNPPPAIWLSCCQLLSLLDSNICCFVQHVEVNKLIRARPLDNIEFMQWLKSYFDSHSNGQNLNYDAAARRAASKTGSVKGASNKQRIPLSSAATTASMNGAAPARSTSISKKIPGTRQFGQAVGSAASVSSSGSQDTSMAAQVQEATEQVQTLLASSQCSRLCITCVTAAPHLFQAIHVTSNSTRKSPAQQHLFAADGLALACSAVLTLVVG